MSLTTKMEPEQPLDRLGAETSLLEAMYSDAVLSYDRTTQELSFKPSAGSGSRLILRLPDGYPASKSPPQVVLASDANKQDRRAQMTGFLKDLTADSSDGEYEEVGEILDQVIERFNEITESTTLDEHTQPTGNNSISTSPSKTVIVWLHHLLATSKRKLALHPSNSPTGAVSGLTKPGYPGIVSFSVAHSSSSARLRRHGPVLNARDVFSKS